MERLTERYDITPDGESDVWVKQHDYISAARKLCDYEDLEEQGFTVLHQYCSSISPHDCIRCTFYEHCPECFMGCPGDQGEVIRKLQSNE